jgi:hypothetical protein
MSKNITEEKRKLSTSLFITLCFALGPVALPIDLLFSSLFDWTPFDITYVFGGFTIIFFVAVFIQAFRKSDEYK